jgi:hypothetical protein
MYFLGASIVARRKVKLRSTKFKFKEMEIELEKIMSSLLLPVQKIAAVKTFLSLSIDFFLLNGEVGRSRLRVMDKKIRGIVNEELKIKRLSIECHHTSRRDGGLSCPSLRDRCSVLTIRLFAQMTLSDDMSVRAAMRQFIEDEREFIRIETPANAQFLDWKEGKRRKHRNVNSH